MILNKPWKKALEYLQNGTPPKGLHPLWTVPLQGEIDGILHPVDKFKEQVAWQPLLDLVELKLQLEVKHLLQEDGLNQLLWEWWLKLRLQDKADSGKLLALQMPQDGTKSQELLL